MKSFKNIILLIVVLILSYVTAPYFGGWYDKFSPQYGSLFLGTSRTGAISFVGFFIAHIFFIPFVYGLFGIKRNKYWIIWPLLPAVLLMLAADKYHFYIPVFLILIALLVSRVINFLISKLHHPNLPMVIK